MFYEYMQGNKMVTSGDDPVCDDCAAWLLSRKRKSEYDDEVEDITNV
jgi:hypothetical protein